MGKFIVGTFLMLGFVFYELSGGSDFVPEGQTEETVEVAVAETPVTEPVVEVTRASTASLVSVSAEPNNVPEAEIIQAVAEVVEETPVEEVIEDVVTEVVVEAPAPLDLRLVAGSRVNMRAGPGTTFDVLDTLNGGTQTEVIEVNATGWARVRVTDTGQIGWMAERLLSES